MVKPKFIRASIIAFWICMIVWLVRFEAFPEFFSHSLRGYVDLVPENVLVMDSWMKIMFNGQPVGYSYTTMDSGNSDVLQQYVIDNKIHLVFEIMGKKENIYINNSTYLNARYNLEKLSASLLSSVSSMSIDFTHAEKQMFNVEIDSGGTIRQMHINLPSDVILYWSMSKISTRFIETGHDFIVNILNPVTMEKEKVIVHILDKELLFMEGTKCEVTHLTMEYKGVNIQIWVDLDGNVMRIKTPFGLVLEKCSSKEAFKMIKNSDGEDIQSIVTKIFSKQI